MRTVLALVFLTGVAFGQVPPPTAPPQTQAAPQSSATGFIAGLVVDAVTGKPIPEAMVLVSGRAGVALGAGGRAGTLPPAPPQLPVLTDSQGRFFFSSLAPGLYAAQVQKAGYASSPFGPIELAAEERVMDWRLKLAKFASLAGTLRDETGDPAVGVDVSLFRRSVVNGRQSWQYSGRQRSDDRGVYRFNSLVAGDFVLCACGRDPIPFDPLLLTTLGSEPVQLMNVAARALSLGADAVSLDGTLRTWTPTFYPNGSSFSRAMKITLAPGDDKTGLDVNLTMTRSTRVSGRILGANGPVQAGAIRLVPEADADAGAYILALTPMLAQPDGRFDFTMVPPGQYRLIVIHRPGTASGGPSGAAMSFAGARGTTPPPPGATMASAGLTPMEPVQWANEPVAVGENGVTGLSVSLKTGVTLTGRVELVGTAPPPPANVLTRMIANLNPVNSNDPMAIASFASGRLAADSTFSVVGAVPGRYTLDFRIPGFATVKSMTMGGQDVVDLPIVVGDKDLADIVITLTDASLASLAINIRTTAGSTGDDGSILVFPADRKYWQETFSARRRFRQIPLPPKNTATTPDLPAGDYLVVSATALEATDWMEAGRLEQLSRRAQRVTVGDIGKFVVEVRR